MDCSRGMFDHQLSIQGLDDQSMNLSAGVWSLRRVDGGYFLRLEVFARARVRIRRESAGEMPALSVFLVCELP